MNYVRSTWRLQSLPRIRRRDNVHHMERRYVCGAADFQGHKFADAISEKRKAFFSEEKKQKTFMSPQVFIALFSRDVRAGAGIKVFLLLFLPEKEELS